MGEALVRNSAANMKLCRSSRGYCSASRHSKSCQRYAVANRSPFPTQVDSQSKSESSERYRRHCASEPSIPLFSRDWWLDAVSADGWDAVLVEKGGHVMASMPFQVEKRRGYRYISQPPLTQTMGPWIRPGNSKYSTALGMEKDLMTALIDQLPAYDFFSQSWHYSRTNWLPFYWRGFKQTTLYTYLLNDLTDLDRVWDDMDSKIRGDIRKASGRFNLGVRDNLDLDEFIDLNNRVFVSNRREAPYSPDLLHRLDSACARHGARKIWVAEDDQKRKHAAIYVVWDENSAYYIMGGGDPELRTSGATSLLLWEAINFAATVTGKFDFEGSMLESIERFFRGFGATQVAYHHVTRTPSKTLGLQQSLAPYIGKLIGRN